MDEKAEKLDEITSCLTEMDGILKLIRENQGDLVYKIKIREIFHDHAKTVFEESKYIPV